MLVPLEVIGVLWFEESQDGVDFKRGITPIRISNVMHFSKLFKWVHEKYVDFA